MLRTVSGKCPFLISTRRHLTAVLEDVEMGGDENEPEIHGNEMLCSEEVGIGSGKQLG